MNIPVVIFKDTASVYGVNVPDIQGVHSWGDSVEDALNNVRTAFTSHIETLLELGKPVEITQSKIVTLQEILSMRAASGHWCTSTLKHSIANREEACSCAKR